MNFIHNLADFGSQIALLDDTGKSLSYQDLTKKADILSEKIGSNKKFVVVKCKNNIKTIIAYIAALRGNHAVLMLDSELDASLSEHLMTHYKPNILLDCSKEGDEIQFQNINSEKQDLHPYLALLLSTSGSTGSPKLVKLTQKNLQTNAASIAEYLQLDHSETPITTLPLHYSYGLSIINSHLLVGAKILLSSHSIVSKEFWRFFKTAEASSLAGVPYTYEMLKRLRIERMELPSLRYMTQAGGKLAPSLVRHFATIAAEKNIRFYTMYGQTEATARISYLPADKVLTKTGSIGIAIPNGKITLEDSSGNIISTPKRDGELIYQGDNVMMGYAETASDLALEDQLNNTLRTGDIAQFDEDGFFYITGRLKRFIKIFGNRVNLEEIEHELGSQGFDCKCIGEDNLLIIATLAEKHHEEIQQYVTQKYHFHHSVIKLFTVTEFPLSSSGKLQYSQLFDLYQSQLTS